MSEARAANIHAGAIALADIGLLVLGGSGAGKSLLAARLIADWPFGAARLVADDRVLISRVGGRLVARPHAAVAGRLELRGFGIVRPRSLDAVVLRAALRLSDATPERLPEPAQQRCALLGLDLPAFDLPAGAEAAERLLAIWPYLRDTVALAPSNRPPHLECCGAV